MKAAISSTSSGGGSLSVDSLVGIEKYVIDSNEKTSKGKERAKVIMKNEDEYNRVVKCQYLKNISEMLDFCSDLHNFVTAACDSQSCIEDLIEQIEMEDDLSEKDVEELMRANVRMARYMKISAKLLDLKASDDDISTQKLKQTIKALLVQHDEMLENLQKQKLDKKYSSSKAWRKSAKVILMVIQAVLVVTSTVVATGMIVVSPVVAFLARSFAPIVTIGFQMIISWIEEYEDSIKAKSDLMTPMREGTHRANAELSDLKDSIGSVVNEIDSLLRRVKLQTEGEPESTTMKGIKEKLEKFQEKLKDLEGQTNKCKAEMVRAREKELERFESEVPKKNKSH